MFRVYKLDIIYKLYIVYIYIINYPYIQYNIKTMNSTNF